MSVGVYLTVSYWLYLPQFWVIIGILFILLELLDGSAIFMLPMGVGALLVAALLYGVDHGMLPFELIPDVWYWLLVYWIIAAVGLVIPLRLLNRRRPKGQSSVDDDINSY